jgi:hypothetical protein
MTRLAKFRTVLVFAFVFVSTLTFSTILNQHGELSTGWHRSSAWGWPKAWLNIHVRDTSHTENGRRVQGERSVEDWSIKWTPFLLSIGVAAAVATVAALPLIFTQRRRPPETSR